jgi:DNA-binding NarL/FixJ family response regulator
MRDLNGKTRHEAMMVDKFKLPPVKSKLWRDMVQYRLREGWGIEDIAIQLHCRVETVREYSRDLAANGVYDRWWPKGQARGQDA